MTLIDVIERFLIPKNEVKMFTMNPKITKAIVILMIGLLSGISSLCSVLSVINTDVKKKSLTFFKPITLKIFKIMENMTPKITKTIAVKNILN